jgi:ATP adenylyltransferase/5',5'''-P-1,P-4-tetraphosphate phosphorylase II
MADKQRSLRALDALNFFNAGIHAGLGAVHRDLLFFRAPLESWADRHTARHPEPFGRGTAELAGRSDSQHSE